MNRPFHETKRKPRTKNATLKRVFLSLSDPYPNLPNPVFLLSSNVDKTKRNARPVRRSVRSLVSAFCDDAENVFHHPTSLARYHVIDSCLTSGGAARVPALAPGPAPRRRRRRSCMQLHAVSILTCMQVIEMSCICMQFHIDSNLHAGSL